VQFEKKEKPQSEIKEKKKILLSSFDIFYATSGVIFEEQSHE